MPVTRFSSVDDVDATRGAGSERGPGGAGRAPRARTPIAKRSGVRSRTGRAGGGREGGSAKVRARRLGCAEDFEIHRPFCSGARKLMTCQHRWEMTERHPAVRRPVPLVGARSAVPSATTRARARSTAASSSSPVPVARRFAMRRRPGIAGIQQRRDKTDALRTVGEDLEQQNLETMRKQLAKFRASLEAFALKHKAEIRRDPAFRAQFHKMCANCGVDPLASNKGFWAEILGFGDFYYELGVQIVEACLATRPQNGGLCEIDQLMTMVLARRGGAAQPVSEDDVLRAIDRLAVLGGGWRGMRVAGRRIVRSVPVELNPDQSEVIRLADAEGGVGGGTGVRLHVRASVQGRERTGVDRERARTALDELVTCGMAMIDDGDPSGGERLFWLPCVSRQHVAGEVKGGVSDATEGVRGRPSIG